MRSLLLALLLSFMPFMLHGSALAANCAVMISHDPAGDPLDDSDLVFNTATWDAIPELRSELQVLTIKLQSDNPLGSPSTVTFTGHDQFGLQAIPKSAFDQRRGIRVAQYDPAGPALGEFIVYRESLDAASPRTSSETSARLKLEASVLGGADDAPVSLDFEDPLYESAQLRSLSLPVIYGGCEMAPVAAASALADAHAAGKGGTSLGPCGVEPGADCCWRCRFKGD